MSPFIAACAQSRNVNIYNAETIWIQHCLSPVTNQRIRVSEGLYVPVVIRLKP